MMLRGLRDWTRLLDLVKNFMLFPEHKAGSAKIIRQNHQMLGVNAAIAGKFKDSKHKNTDLEVLKAAIRP